MLLLILALLALALDLAFAKKVWPAGSAAGHMQALFDHALAISPNPSLTDALAEASYWFFFGLSGIHDRVLALGDTPFARASNLLALREEIAVAMMGAKVFGARLGTVINAVPLLFIAYLAFTTDGLAERLIRKACGGRELGTRYQWAKRSHFALLPVLLALYLCVPARFDPLWVVLPAILVSGLMLRVQTKYYKKYV